MSEDKSDSISSDEDELAFSSDEEDGLAATAVVDHYESLVSMQTCLLQRSVHFLQLNHIQWNSSHYWARRKCPD